MSEGRKRRRPAGYFAGRLRPAPLVITFSITSDSHSNIVPLKNHPHTPDALG